MEFPDPSVIGNQAPLVTENTVNLGGQYRRPLGDGNFNLFARADYQRIGETWWDPANSTVRNPVDLLDLRLGLEGDSWSVVGWQRNFNDVEYNAEFSPGGFVFKAKPRRWGSTSRNASRVGRHAAPACRETELAAKTAAPSANQANRRALASARTSAALQARGRSGGNAATRLYRQLLADILHGRQRPGLGYGSCR